MPRPLIRFAIATSLAGALIAAAVAPPALAQLAPEIAKTQSLPAKRLSPLLPDRPLAGWLAERLGTAGSAVWELKDCGGQTGGPVERGADRGGDLPLCVEIWAKLKSNAEAGLVVQIGTRSKRWSGRPRVRALYVRAGDVSLDFRKVRAWLRQIDLVNRTAPGGR